MSQHARLTRRIVGLLNARLPDLQLHRMPDHRDPRWVSWPLVTVLRALNTCLAASCTSLRQAEELTEQMSLPIRRKLGIRGRIADTTMRTIAAGLEPDDVRQHMHQQIRAAARRKALVPDALPFNVAMLDGKSTALPSCDDHFAQRQSNDSRLIGLLRTMTCSLVTTTAQPCIDAMFIPAATNEMGHFRYCVDQLLAAYGSIDLLRMVAADAGNCCEANARHARDVGLHYLFGLKDNQPTLAAEDRYFVSSLSAAEPRRNVDDTVHCGLVCYPHPSRQARAPPFPRDGVRGRNSFGYRHFNRWEAAADVLCSPLPPRRGKGPGDGGNKPIWSLTASLHRLSRLSGTGTSLPASRLTCAQWLRLVRLMWGVENAVHCTLDKSMREDEHPWIKANPKAALVIALLRRIAYNLLALFRSVTLRSEHSRSTPWKRLMRWVELALLTATHHDVAGLRARDAPASGIS